MQDHSIVFYYDNQFFRIDTQAVSLEKAISNAKFRLANYLSRFKRYGNLSSIRLSIGRCQVVTKPVSRVVMVN